MYEYIKNFHFDPISSALTLILLSLLWRIKDTVLRKVKEYLEFLFDGLIDLVDRFVRQTLAATLTMKRYCKLQLGKEEIRFLRVPCSQDKILDIDKIFVKLSMSYSEQESYFTNTDFLTIGNRIKVMGDPGSGKSSLIKRVFRDQCLSGVYNPRKTKFPILVELKNVNTKSITDDTDLGTWFYNYIKVDVAKKKAYKTAECMDSYAISKGLLVLLDGLDEVSSSNYNIITELINKLSVTLAEQSVNNVIVLTMRTQFYQLTKDDFAANFPHAAFLRPFTPSDIYQFLSNWPFEGRTENISRIYKDLTDKPTLREMCSNPLVLSMYVAEDQISSANFSPESRTLFYKRVTEELIIARRSKQKQNLSSSYSTLKEQRERILGKIAYEHITNIEEPSNNLSWGNAIEIIRSILNCDNKKAELVFNEISTETGLITVERPMENFRFIHLTFCEFLAAFHVVQEVKYGWTQLIAFHKEFTNRSLEKKSRLIEVIPFTSGLMSRVNRQEALSDIAVLNDNTLMARCFLETKYYEHSSWSDFIDSAKNNLLNKSLNQFDEKWLRDLHIFNVVITDATYAADNLNITQSFNLPEFYETLLDNEQDNISRILSAYATQDAAAAFRICEICNINLQNDFPAIVIANCDQAPFMGLVKERITKCNSDSRYWAALLSESALQKRVVAQLLNEMPKNEQLEIKILEDIKPRFWHYRKKIPNTFLLQCISYATNGETNYSHTTSLHNLVQLKTPHENRFRIITSVSIKYFIGAIGILLLILLIMYFREEKDKYLTLTIITLTILYVGSLFTVDILTFYQYALNLKDGKANDDEFSGFLNSNMFLSRKTLDTLVFLQEKRK